MLAFLSVEYYKKSYIFIGNIIQPMKIQVIQEKNLLYDFQTAFFQGDSKNLLCISSRFDIQIVKFKYIVFFFCE